MRRFSILLLVAVVVLLRSAVSSRDYPLAVGPMLSRDELIALTEPVGAATPAAGTPAPYTSKRHARAGSTSRPSFSPGMPGAALNRLLKPVCHTPLIPTVTPAD